jgi:hypothetical protein
VPSQSDAYLNALIADHAALRQDGQTFNVVIAGLLSVAVALMGGLGAFLFTSSCAGPPLRCRPTIWEPIYAVLPLPALALLALYGRLGNIATLRGFYLRGLENELQRLAQSPEVQVEGSAPIRLPSFTHLVIGLSSQRRGLLQYRFLTLIIYLTIGLLFATTTAVCMVLARPIDLQIVMGLAYAGSSAVLGRVLWCGSLGGRKLWKLTTEMPTPPEQPAETSRPARRSLLGYVILPRPQDLLVKGGIIPLAWAWASFAGPSDQWRHVLPLLGFTLAFELFLYQARYIVNDLRGLDVDIDFSKFRPKPKFPLPAGAREVKASLIAIIFRLGFTIWFALRVLTPPFRGALLAALGMVLVLTIVYEILRARSERIGPKDDLLTMSLTPTLVLVFVGAGYGLRACLGVYLATPGHTDWLLIGSTAVAMTAFGSMFVAMRWAIKRSVLVVLEEGERPPTHAYRDVLKRMRHIAPLLREARVLEDHGEGLDSVSSEGPSDAHPLHAYRILELISSPTWWNVAVVLAASFAAVAGVRLMEDRRLGALLLAAAVGVAEGVGVVLIYGGDSAVRGGIGGMKASRLRALLPIGVASTLLAALVASHGIRAVAVAIIPSAVVGGVYVIFRHSSPDDLDAKPDPGWLDRVGWPLARTLLGETAARKLINPKQQQGP